MYPRSNFSEPAVEAANTLKRCGSVSCLINMEPLELLRLQPSEPIGSESTLDIVYDLKFVGPLEFELVAPMPEQNHHNPFL